MFSRLNVLGYQIVNESATQAACGICDNLNAASRHTIVFLNPHSIAMADRDTELRAALADADLTFCDGVGLQLAGRALANRSIRRVYGYDLFMALSAELSRRHSGRVFFLGGTPELLAELTKKYSHEFPGIAAVESFAPPFAPSFRTTDLTKMTERISEFKPDILWVGVGSPKQEKLLALLKKCAPFGFGAAIGAVFDFYAGRIPHSPKWIRRLGLQWLHRLLLEPRRLWRRTFISAPLFILKVFAEMVSRRH